MSHYTELIIDILKPIHPDVADVPTANIIEALMRTNRTALDYLTRAEFEEETAQWAALMHPAAMGPICRMLDLPLPVWAQQCSANAGGDPGIDCDEWADGDDLLCTYHRAEMWANTARLAATHALREGRSSS